jgi:hypothetical protein
MLRRDDSWSIPTTRSYWQTQPFETEQLRRQMRIDVLKLGARQALRSAIRPDEEWARLGFPMEESAEKDDDDASSDGGSEQSAEEYRQSTSIPSAFSTKSNLKTRHVSLSQVALHAAAIDRIGKKTRFSREE